MIVPTFFPEVTLHMKNPNEFRHKKTVKLLFILFAIGICAAITLAVGMPMLRVVQNPEQFRAWVRSHGILGYAAFICMMVVQVVVALIPGEPFEIAAGYAFGVWIGSALCLLSTLIGSAIIFQLTKRYGTRIALLFFTQRQLDSLPFLRKDKKGRRADAILFLLMILPGTPKDLLSYGAGLMPISFWGWMWLVAVTRLPTMVPSVIGGNALGSRQYLLSIVIFAATMAVSALGYFFYRQYSKHKTAG